MVDPTAGGYRKAAKVKSPFPLRTNAYRVLLTRGRDGKEIMLAIRLERQSPYAGFLLQGAGVEQL